MSVAGSGLMILCEVKSAQEIKIDGKRNIVSARNNESLKVFIFGEGKDC